MRKHACGLHLSLQLKFTRLCDQAWSQTPLSSQHGGMGNERWQRAREVLITVLTKSESARGLEPLARRLVDRYRRAGQPHPLVLYTDRDCCAQDGPSKLVALFNGWEGVTVSLDVWHFMRHISDGVTSESHPLYGTFMQQLRGCIFEWDDHSCVCCDTSHNHTCVVIITHQLLTNVHF